MINYAMMACLVVLKPLGSSRESSLNKMKNIKISSSQIFQSPQNFIFIKPSAYAMNQNVSFVMYTMFRWLENINTIQILQKESKEKLKELKIGKTCDNVKQCQY